MSVNNANVLFNYIAFLIASVFALLVNVFVIKYYDADTLGYLNFFLAIVILSSQFSVGGVQFSVLKHAALFVDRNKELSIILSSSILLVVAYFAFFVIASYLVLICFDFFSLNVSFFWYLCLLGTVLFFSLNKVFLSFVNGISRLKLVAFFNGCRFVILFALMVSFYFFQSDKEFIILTVLMSEVILFLLYIFVIIKGFLCSRLYGFNWLKKHAGFGVKGFFGGALMEVNTRVDVIMLTAMLGYTSVGIYSFASMIAEGFVQTFTVLKNNADPIFSKACKENNIALIESVITQIRERYVGLLCLLGIIGCVFFPVVFLYVFNIDPLFVYQAWLILVIYVGFVVVSAKYRPFIGLTIQANKPQVFSVVILVSVVVNLILNYLLIKAIGVSGAAVATGVAFFCESFLLYKYSQAKLKITI